MTKEWIVGSKSHGTRSEEYGHKRLQVGKLTPINVQVYLHTCTIVRSLLCKVDKMPVQTPQTIIVDYLYSCAGDKFYTSLAPYTFY